MIPGFLIAWATFPGVIVHELAHQLFCRLYGLKVVQVCYFRFGNPAGYVVHLPAGKPWQNVMVAIGPFFVNSILGAAIGCPAMLRLQWAGEADLLDFFLAWLGLSIAMHSFPSTGDAKNVWATARSKETPLATKLFAVPVTGLIYACAIGSFFWLDLGWGVLLTLLIPMGIVQLLS